ncbi:MAG TPA: helix-turn-helix domain-containing protein [Propionicimonas sp.]|jgi:excisionase family DNA binding protein
MAAQHYESLAQAAERTGISLRTLRRRIASGELPAFASGRRILRVRPEDVDNMLRPAYSLRSYA